MVLAVRRLHQITTQIVIKSWKAAGLGVAPGIALNRSQPLCGELGRDRVHAHLRIDQDMGSVGQDGLAPALERQRSLHEAVAGLGGDAGVTIRLRAGVIAEDPEAGSVQLRKPALDRNLPVRMLTEEAADDPGGAIGADDQLSVYDP